MPSENISRKVRGAAAVEPFLRPKSVAIIGFSSRAGSAGQNAYKNFVLNHYEGEIHLVGRSGGEIDGRKVLTEIDQLPEGVDLAIFTLPAAGAKEAMEACARRKVKAVVIFSSGFAEIGNREAQDELAKIAREGGVALLGPNCLGYTNLTNGVHAGFVAASEVVRTPDVPDPKTAIISASGGLMGHIRMGLEQRGIPAAYTISTGNEAGIGIADFVEFFADDPLTSMIIVYVEQVHEPENFIAAAKKAQANGRSVVMMHPGRTGHARQAVSSHTGALAGDHAVMKTLVEHAGILFIDNVDELIDSAEILARFPKALPQGPGILTFSGALCAIYHDFCDELGIEVPPLSPDNEKRMRAALPSFATPRNPLDLTTQPVWEPELMTLGVDALLGDPDIGSCTINIPMGNPKMALSYLEYTLQGHAKYPEKPLVFGAMGENSPLPPDFAAMAKEKRVIVTRSADRSLRAIRHWTFHGRNLERAKQVAPLRKLEGLPKLGSGPQPEWLGKDVFRAVGIPVPQGGLAKSADEAVKIAGQAGFPVAMKAQAAQRAPKTEAGGVLLNIADDAGVRKAGETRHANIERHAPGMKLDGVLVEKMSGKGVELVVGARRDPRWGPVVLVGAGGILVEAIGDVRLLPPDLNEEAIVAEIGKLKTAKLLQGFRGAPPADVKAVAKVAAAIGQLMRNMPEIVEIDVNPLVAHADGVIALDALIVTA
ncbi:MAG: acetate--CoA ligase family protein [Beijerinckiaceae bacterium]